MIDFGAKIQELCDLFGWDVAKLSKEANVSQSTIQRILNRKNIPSIDTIEKICGAFEIPICVFLDDRTADSQMILGRRFLQEYHLLSEEEKKFVRSILENLTDRQK